MTKGRVILFTILSVNVFSQQLDVRSPLQFLALGDSYTIGAGVAEEDRWPVQLVSALNQLGVYTEKLTIIAQTGWRTDDLMNAVYRKSFIFLKTAYATDHFSLHLLPLQNLFNLIHYAVHGLHGFGEWFAGGHVDAGFFEQVDRVIRTSRR